MKRHVDDGVQTTSTRPSRFDCAQDFANLASLTEEYESVLRQLRLRVQVVIAWSFPFLARVALCFLTTFHHLECSK